MAAFFVDTSFWIALLNKADADYARALAWRKHIAASSTKLITTHAVLWEMANALSYRAARIQAAFIYRRSFSDPDIEVIPFEQESNDVAIDLFESRADKDWSLTDCLSFVTMRQRQLTQALTADHHFTQASFDALLTRQPPGA